MLHPLAVVNLGLVKLLSELLHLAFVFDLDKEKEEFNIKEQEAQEKRRKRRERREEKRREEVERKKPTS